MVLTTTTSPQIGNGPPCPVNVLDMPLHPVDFGQALDLLMNLAEGDRCAYAVTPNVDHLVRYAKSPQLRPLYEQADLVVADGMPLIWASRLLRTPLPERVAGSDLFPALCARAADVGLSVFLLGGATGAAEAAARALTARHAALRIVGTYCPPFGFERDAAERARVVDTVRRAAPDILFVGLGSPKQEQWIAANREACGAKLSLGVGISFSFMSGHVKRAPEWMQRAGLEWLHRLAQEPGRLWKRYLIVDASFLTLVIRDLLKRRRASSKKTTIRMI